MLRDSSIRHRAAPDWQAIAGSVALTGGPSSPAVDWLVLPVVTLAARFDRRGVIAGTVIAAMLMLASTVGVHPVYVVAHPQYVVFALALLGRVAMLSLALMRSDLQHRTASVIDPLITMLNRNALIPRIEELRHQAQLVSQPIGVILGDWTTSRRSTTATDTLLVTPYSKTSSTACVSSCARSISPTASAARNSSSCSPAPTPSARA